MLLLLSASSPLLLAASSRTTTCCCYSSRHLLLAKHRRRLDRHVMTTMTSTSSSTIANNDDRQTPPKIPLRGVVFDMDGTLTVPNLDFAEMYRRAGLVMGKDDILSPKHRSDPTVCTVINEMEEEGQRTMRLMPGTTELITWLHAHAIPMAIVTRNSCRTLDYFFANVWPSQTTVPNPTIAISRDDPYPSKPNPKALHVICEKWGITNNNPNNYLSIIMVGDSPSNDIAFGKEAGVSTALLDTGRRYTKGGKTGNPDFIVDNLSQLAPLLWRDYEIKSALTDPALHVKRLPPIPSSEAAIAATKGDVSSLEKMDPTALSSVDEMGQTPLIWAANAGNLAVVNHLLLNTAGVVDNINTRGYLGNTAISRAARHGHVDVLHALLKHGANMEVCNNKQQYPLHFAAFKHKLEAVNVLLNFGASPLVLDRKGRTPAEDTSNEEIRNIIRMAQCNYVEAGIQ